MNVLDEINRLFNKLIAKNMSTLEEWQVDSRCKNTIKKDTRTAQYNIEDKVREIVDE